MISQYILSKCPDCNSTVSHKGSEVICNKCGLVIADNLIEDGSEYQAHSEGRTGRANPITTQRLRNAESRANRTSDRNMAFALAYIRRLTQSLYLPSSSAIEAIRLYKKVFSMGLIKGRNIEVVTSALVYAVSRQMGLPRTIKEFCAFNDTNKRDVFRMYKFLLRTLELKCPICKPDDYLFRFANVLGHGEKVKTRALEILSRMPADNNHSPITLAAAALYVAGLENSEHRSFKKISRLLGVGEAAIRETVLEVAKMI